MSVTTKKQSKAKRAPGEEARRAPAKKAARAKVPKRAPAKRARPAPQEKTPDAPGERRADHDLVDQTIDMLAAHDEAREKSVLAIGLHVLDRFFDGDEEAMRSKSPTKTLSFALLAERARAETSWTARVV